MLQLKYEYMVNTMWFFLPSWSWRLVMTTITVATSFHINIKILRCTIKAAVLMQILTMYRHCPARDAHSI